MNKPISIYPLSCVKEIRTGDNLAEQLLASIEKNKMNVIDKDIIVVTSKIVSKSEGRIVKLEDVLPSEITNTIAASMNKNPKLLELIFNEAKNILRLKNGIIITEMEQDIICANSGIDQSNVEKGKAVLLPKFPNKSASEIREHVMKKTGKKIAIIISDTIGRPWREGLTNIAIGFSGISPFRDYRGKKDIYGRKLESTVINIIDELASATELVMGKTESTPFALVRGYEYSHHKDRKPNLLRQRERDFFR